MASGTHINTRVEVLENNFRDLRTTVDNGRVETRQGFDDVRAQLQRMSDQMAATAATQVRPTNWIGLASAAGATIAVLGALFSLAEWRVGVAADPVARTLELSRRTTEKQAEQIIELRVEHGILKDRLRRMSPEQRDTATR